MVLGMIALVSLLIGCAPQFDNDTSHTEQRVDTIIQSDRDAERTYEIIHDRYAEELGVQRKALREAFLEEAEDVKQEEARAIYADYLAELESVHEEAISHMEEIHRIKEDATQAMHNEWVESLASVFSAESFMLLFGDEELILPYSDLIIH